MMLHGCWQSEVKYLQLELINLGYCRSVTMVHSTFLQPSSSKPNFCVLNELALGLHGDLEVAFPLSSRRIGIYLNDVLAEPLIRIGQAQVDRF